MCDLAFINLLREQVRQLEARDRRTVAFGPMPRQRFVPWIMPAQSQPQSAPGGRIAPDANRLIDAEHMSAGALWTAGCSHCLPEGAQLHPPEKGVPKGCPKPFLRVD